MREVGNRSIVTTKRIDMPSLASVAVVMRVSLRDGGGWWWQVAGRDRGGARRASADVGERAGPLAIDQELRAEHRADAPIEPSGEELEVDLGE